MSIEIIDTQDEYSIPLDISDLITICQEYNQLGWNIQQQIGMILEDGLEETIKSGTVKREALPHIKSFLRAITRNPLFGDASEQAKTCIDLIDLYQETNHPNRLAQN
jgi:hypothetical protein